MSAIKNNRKILYISYDGMTDPLGQSQVISYLIGLTKYGYSFHILSFEKKEKWISTGNEIQNLLDENGIKWFPKTFHTNPPILSKVYDKFLLLQKAKMLSPLLVFPQKNKTPLLVLSASIGRAGITNKTS